MSRRTAPQVRFLYYFMSLTLPPQLLNFCFFCCTTAAAARHRASQLNAVGPQLAPTPSQQERLPARHALPCTPQHSRRRTGPALARSSVCCWDLGGRGWGVLVFSSVSISAFSVTLNLGEVGMCILWLAWCPKQADCLRKVMFAWCASDSDGHT